MIRYISRYDRGRFALAIAGPYALIVVGVTIYVEISTRQPGSQGLEAIWLFAVTSPASQILLLLPLPAPEISRFLFPAAGLLQAWILWLIVRGRRKSMTPAGALPLRDDHEGQDQNRMG
ncbi:hypothetical protein GCM10009555_020950 [Acrocarpospora macrocephala]|uniref:Uncharacterized protein n=2 Tax=Acrocarpospora macrocephala TaxID=150177 RepID=A0A5M3WFM9_9ACTN|nr:hypothetical protein Amac_015000 [Acrocarpospora macrocephala]